LSRAKSGASLDKEAGGTPPSRSRDPRQSALLRRRRELENNSAQVTARKRARPRHAGWIADDDWSRRARTAFDRGAQSVRPGVIEWDASGRCEEPVFRTLKGMPTDFWGNAKHRSNHNPTMHLDMWVPCRRCLTCLRRKATHWKMRAMSEVAASEAMGGRTWRVTLTFEPHYRARMTMSALRAVGEEDWAEMSQELRSASLAKQAQPYVTLWMKRVRAQSGAALRYLSVTELHEDGFPHCHLLVHESTGDMPIRHAVLAGQWAYGFSNVKLVRPGDPHAAEYATKYCSKSPFTRVRASVGYGH